MNLDLIITILINVIEVIIFLVAVLFAIAFLTVAERKTLGYMQRRLGPNAVGYYGLLQAFADAVKLLIKEIFIPKQANRVIFIISPMITLVTSLVVWVVIPFGPSLTLADLENGILFALSIGSLGVFGSLLSGWGSNSKYAFLGSIRSTAALISYELVLTTVYIIILMFTSGLNFTGLINFQLIIWYCVPLFPISILFLISTIAETNRPPFDLIEAENELVAGFFTEYSSSPFVLFFLAEYGNVIFMSSASVILLFGGYLGPFSLSITPSVFNIIFEGILYGYSMGIKLCIFCFIFIWVRATFPRYTFDNLITLCWTIFLPVLFGYFIFVPTLLYFFNAFTL